MADRRHDRDIHAAADHGEHGAFDPIRPPQAGLVADCVHCGFCLPACPTYTLWGQEMDSPRGRIWLMRLGLEGEADIDPTFAGHFDACLGCMACVSACPSGVQYDVLLEATRAQIERNHPRRLPDRLFRMFLFFLFPSPRRLRVAAALALLYQRLRLPTLLRRTGLRRLVPTRLRALEELLPPVRVSMLRSRLPQLTPAVGPPRRRVALLTGCVQSVFFDDVNAATARVLAAEGCDVVAQRGQRCCGALQLHAGEDAAARKRAKQLIADLESADVDTIVVNAAGCGAAMKDYARLLGDDPRWAESAAGFAARVRDVSEVLDELEPRAERHPLPTRVAYHDACHLRHAQGIHTQPRRLLAAIPQLVLTHVREADMCCGSAGVYNLLQPEPADELGRRKADHLLRDRPDVVASGNPGCLLQIRRRLPSTIPVVHTIQLLDWSIRPRQPAGPPVPTRVRR